MKKLLFLGSTILSLPFTIISSKLEKNNEINISLAKKIVLEDYKKITRMKDVKIKFTKYLQVDKNLRSLLVVYEKRGYSIISLANGKIIEVNPFSKKYLNLDKEVQNEKLLYKYLNDIKILDKDNKELKSNFKKEIFYNNDENSLNLKIENLDYKSSQNRGKPEFEWPKGQSEKAPFVYADYEVPYSWYFKLSGSNNHGYLDGSGYQIYKDYSNIEPYYKGKYYGQSPESGLCGYIAMNLLIMYRMLFYNSNYFNDWEKEEFVRPGEDIYHSNYLDSNHLPTLKPDFTKYLYQKTWFATGVDKWWNLKYIVDSFLKNKWQQGKINYSHWGDYSFFGKPWSTIVYNKTPTALAGLYSPGSTGKDGHVIVAYGANRDGRFLVNLGWGANDSQVFVTKELFSHGMNYALNDKSERKMGQNRFFSYNGELIDGSQFEQILNMKGII
ncbi:hypothetical protein OF364_01450 [Mycoplasma enhydrae]|uniref:putative cysteine peptidase n=1 Tax=Mycoplasma enhydrae TaxID=2499220 RepID=UPI0021E729E7|nr:hypothetical protein [Mycoplasma enhydrae]MCV3753478.1 hypothetical protein [Mycoplasma enhydrae]